VDAKKKSIVFYFYFFDEFRKWRILTKVWLESTNIYTLKNVGFQGNSDNDNAV